MRKDGPESQTLDFKRGLPDADADPEAWSEFVKDVCAFAKYRWRRSGHGIGDRAGAADQVVLILNQTTDAVSVIEKYYNIYVTY